MMIEHLVWRGTQHMMAHYLLAVNVRQLYPNREYSCL